MQRLRLKADGRIVELRDGQEFPLAPAMPGLALAMPGSPRRLQRRRRMRNRGLPAVRDLRRRAQLTQIEFAARLGVPVETIRNWEQGKRVPRGPARALLAVIAHSPETVFAALATRTVAGLVTVDAFLRASAAGSRETLSVGTAVSAAHNRARSADTTDAVCRSQWRKNPGDRAGHLGIARTRLRADRRAGAAARLSPHRHRADVRERARGRRGRCAPRA